MLAEPATDLKFEIGHLLFFCSNLSVCEAAQCLQSGDCLRSRREAGDADSQAGFSFLEIPNWTIRLVFVGVPINSLR